MTEEIEHELDRLMRKTPERSRGKAAIRFEELETNVRRTALRIAAQGVEAGCKWAIYKVPSKLPEF
jgi:hypothetical protein